MANMTLTCALSSFSLFFVFSLDVTTAATQMTGSQPHKKLWVSALNSRSDNTVIAYCRYFCKFKVWCLHSSRELLFLPATIITVSSFLHYLIAESQGSSTIHGAFYAINWVHKLAGFEKENPCNSFLVKSIAEAAMRIPRKPVRKVEPITPEILSSLVKYYGDNKNLLDIRFVCMCLLSFAGFFRISELLGIKRNNIVTEDTYHKIFVEVSKVDKYREGSWVYIAKTGKSTCPYTYLLKYLRSAEIPSDSCDFIFRSLRYDKKSRGNVLSIKPLTAGRAREILKAKLQTIGVDGSKFSSHSFRSGGATSAANLDVPDRLFKLHGRWKSESAKDGYVHDKVESHLLVSKNIGI